MKKYKISSEPDRFWIDHDMTAKQISKLNTGTANPEITKRFGKSKPRQLLMVCICEKQKIDNTRSLWNCKKCGGWRQYKEIMVKMKWEQDDLPPSHLNPKSKWKKYGICSTDRQPIKKNAIKSGDSRIHKQKRSKKDKKMGKNNK